ncbi:uncharacterized protein LOC133381920 isoform X2 [Rhineura floridana]|uniref:uncharacterized protein LOC133381920 isoform X2 n=1 Tax=Rhineura floridana TaxID=261503 RepID=UPI002AC85D5B|nr:uncharacterized protein LOC133381920 isoform X2 [Rhineura floridana]
MEENYEIGASFKSELNSCLEDGEDLLIQVPKEEETTAERDLASCKEEGESLFIQVPKEEEEETSAEPDLISCWEGGEDPVMQEPKEEEEISAERDDVCPSPILRHLSRSPGFLKDDGKRFREHIRKSLQYSGMQFIRPWRLELI